MGKIIVYSFLAPSKLTLTAAMVCGFGFFFERSIFCCEDMKDSLFSLEEFSLAFSLKSGVYITFCNPVVLCENILSSVGFISFCISVHIFFDT